MLNFAEQTGSGAVMIVWSFLILLLMPTHCETFIFLNELEVVEVVEVGEVGEVGEVVEVGEGGEGGEGGEVGLEVPLLSPPLSIFSFLSFHL